MQISLTSIYKLIHRGEIPAVKLATLTIHVNCKAFEECLQRAQQPVTAATNEGDEQ